MLSSVSEARQSASSEEPAEAEEVDDAGEPAEDSGPSAADPLRDFFSRPEVTGAIAGLGRALSKLGAQIQEAADQPSSEE